jgi:hypothetical protein
MVVGAAAGLGSIIGSLGLRKGLQSVGPAAASVGMAGLAAAAFGYNYGYHVRRGYHDFKPSKNQKTSDLIASIDPNKQNAGLGMMAAEQRTDQKIGDTTVTTEPSLVMESSSLAQNEGDPWIYSKVSGTPRIRKSKIKTHQQYVDYIKRGINPETGKRWSSYYYAKRYNRLSRTAR